MSDESRVHVEIVKLSTAEEPQNLDAPPPPAPPSRGAALSVLWWSESDPEAERCERCG